MFEITFLLQGAACLLGLSATRQQYFSLRTNQSPATSQQYFSLRINQHQSSTTSQTNRLEPCYTLFSPKLFLVRIGLA
jgi:hypothetical protein